MGLYLLVDKLLSSLSSLMMFSTRPAHLATSSLFSLCLSDSVILHWKRALKYLSACGWHTSFVLQVLVWKGRVEFLSRFFSLRKCCGEEAGWAEKGCDLQERCTLFSLIRWSLEAFRVYSWALNIWPTPCGVLESSCPLVWVYPLLNLLGLDYFFSSILVT